MWFFLKNPKNEHSISYLTIFLSLSAESNLHDVPSVHNTPSLLTHLVF